jgi:hypothetical protein
LKVRDINSQCSGCEIAINDDHTYIARAGNYDEPTVQIIDQRTSLPLHQIKNDTNHSQNSGIKWHDNHLMTSHWSGPENIVQLYDIRKGGSSSSSASPTTLLSRIWSFRSPVAFVDFSNDFQIALLNGSVVDIASTATPLYTFPIRVGICK